VSERPQDVLYKIAADFGQTCDLLEVTKEIPCIEDCMTGDFEFTLPDFNLWWVIDTFVDDPEIRLALKRAPHVIRRVFLDLAKLEQAMTGKASRLPERLIRALTLAFIESLKPSVYQICTGAKHHPADKASATLIRLTEVSAWYERRRQVYG
jgi:hypothetical protein